MMEGEATFRAVVDRIEGNIAVCEMESGKMVDVPLTTLVSHIKEGDTLLISCGSNTVPRVIRKVETRRMKIPTRLLRF